MTDNDPLVGEDILRREDRCRKSGGIGCAVILIQCGEISQVMPVEVDSPSRISWDMRDDWSEVLRHFVESGRTDFKPISTTATVVVFLQLHKFELAERFKYVLQVLLRDTKVNVSYIEAVEGDGVGVGTRALGVADLAVLLSFGKLDNDRNT